jgi:effector-binding domain-containing protein
MSEEPTIVERPATAYAAIKVLVPMDELGTTVPPLNGEVFQWLAAHHVAPAGAPFWKYNVIDMAGRLEVEAGVAVAEPVSGDQRVLGGVLPPGRYATTRHVGHPSTLMAATAALLEWGAAHGVEWDKAATPDGERWGARLEIYLTDPQDEPDMHKWVTELAFRCAPGPA